MKKNIRRVKLLLYIIYIFVGWYIVMPISYLLKKFFKKRYILFIGRDNGKFLDNVKYLYLYFLKRKKEIENKKLEILFLTENKNIYHLLKENKQPVLYFPSIKGLRALLSTKLLIVDNWMWIKNFKNFILKAVKKIQLWHGVPIKYIEFRDRNEFKNFKSRILNKLNRLIGIFTNYDIVISTSPFYTEKVFSKAFNAKSFWETGYPRNDIFFNDLDKYNLLFTDKKALNIIRNKKKEGYKTILYAPTFRDSGGDAFTDGALNGEKMDIFLTEMKTLMVIKFHPDPNFNYQLFSDCKNILFYDNDKDVYPLLKDVDCLITDYSSIYMDYLLTDNPIIFFPYDYDKYITKDREIQFEYNWITPGEKAFKQEELEALIKKILVDKIDEFKEKRKEIRKIAFKYQDGSASERVFIKILNLLKSIEE
ncbi:MAG: CDP-glycerol glycerophosphotransferase family protein [Candidatus Aenigmarchaeota archaeon]|nr:CDP-glycerol glycerophosphotransferase family protein [Candidatus Aenigmarchaeota archaeon]